MEPFYRVNSADDLVGHLAIGLAPHTSGGVLCRIIGWTDASAAMPTHYSMQPSVVIAMEMRTVS